LSHNTLVFNANFMHFIEILRRNDFRKLRIKKMYKIYFILNFFIYGTLIKNYFFPKD